MKKFKAIREKKLTPAELKKREEIAKAIERDKPDMPMAKKMAIATATAKRVAEGIVKTADKKPEKYVKPDGKTGVRMVPVDKQIVKSEDQDMSELSMSLKDIRKTGLNKAITKDKDKIKKDLEKLKKGLGEAKEKKLKIYKTKDEAEKEAKKIKGKMMQLGSTTFAVVKED